MKKSDCKKELGFFHGWHYNGGLRKEVSEMLKEHSQLELSLSPYQGIYDGIIHQADHKVVCAKYTVKGYLLCAYENDLDIDAVYIYRRNKTPTKKWEFFSALFHYKGCALS